MKISDKLIWVIVTIIELIVAITVFGSVSGQGNIAATKLSDLAPSTLMEKGWTIEETTQTTGVTSFQYSSVNGISNAGSENLICAKSPTDTIKKRSGDSLVFNDSSGNEEILIQINEVSGLIMDESRTKSGYDFYEAFCNKWGTGKITPVEYTIIIIEQPISSSLSIITIKVNEDDVFQKYFKPVSGEIEQSADEAIIYVENYLTNYDEIKKRLEEEYDMHGSGLY